METRIVKPGFRSGLLEVLEEAPLRDGRKMWLCRCDCGGEKVVSDSHLISGHTKSCGCISRRKSVHPGQHFGQLTLIEELPRRNGFRFWLCRCSCGNECEISETHLKTGHTKSCGCLHRKAAQSKFIDLVGQRFGRLTVTGLSQNRIHCGVTWHCICVCGNELDVEAEYLLRDKTRSCGCLKEEQRKINMEKAIHFVDGTCIEKIACQREIATNTSGHRGVTRRPNGAWRAELTFQGKRYHLGYFDAFEDAVKARLKGEEMYTEYLDNYYNKKSATMQENYD